MSSNLDRTLDQVIATRPKNKRRTQRRTSAAKANLVGNKASAPAAKAKVAAAATAAPSGEKKIIVSNLPTDVNETQIKELFASQVGPCRVTLSYNAKGVSTGVANIIFNKAGDGSKAFQLYNGRLIDGKTPMKVEIVVDPTRPQSLSQRVGPAPATAGGAVVAAAKKKKARTPRNKGPKRPKKTAEDLDAEMADYTSGAGSTAATAAPAA